MLYGFAAAASVNKRAVANVRLSVVRGESIIWPAGITAQQKTAALAQLAALNIIAR